MPDCMICGKAAYLGRDGRGSFCAACRKETMEDEVELTAQYHSQGHTLECAERMSRARPCICGKEQFNFPQPAQLAPVFRDKRVFGAYPNPLQT